VVALKVAVLGAAGTIAPAIVRDLADSEEVESVLLLDLRGEIAERVAAEHGGGKASAREADARAGLAGELAGCDALVNSASYRINLDAMRACLDAGCHYLDLGGLYHLTGEQMAMNDEFEAAGLLAVLGIGSSPGKTNLMAARAVAELDPVSSIGVCAASRDLDPPPGLSLPYALETLIDELTLPPVVLRDGEPAEVEPLSDGGEVDFGEEIGVAGTIYTLHSELRTFGESFGCRQCSFRLSLSPALLEKLRELTSAGPEQVREAGGEAGRQSSQTVSVHVIDAAGGGRAVRMRSVTPPHAEWGMGGGIVSTASPAAAAVRLIARGGVSARGALPPERCIDPAQMFSELETRGCRFHLDVKEESAG
jgi:lysine 6-dehydrogenase